MFTYDIISMMHAYYIIKDVEHMNCEVCNMKGSACVAIIISILLGLLIGVLVGIGEFPFLSVIFTSNFALAFSSLMLILLFISVYIAMIFHHSYRILKCFCGIIPLWAVGVFGTLLFALILLTFSIQLHAMIILLAIFVGIEIFFLSLIFLGAIAFIKCILCTICRYQKEEC